MSDSMNMPNKECIKNRMHNVIVIIDLKHHIP